MDRKTMRLYEQSLADPTKVQNLDKLLQFISERANALEAYAESSPTNVQPSKKIEYRRNDSESAKIYRRKCYLCNGEHSLFKCDKFKNQDVNKRWEVIKKHKLCSVCFGKHMTEECKSKFTCKLCQGRHSMLLHNEKKTISAYAASIECNEVVLAGF